MKRLNFIRSLLIAPAVAALSGFRTKPETIKLTDVFKFYEHNENVATLRSDSKYFKLIVNQARKMAIPIYDRSPVYLGLHEIPLAIKDEYSEAELTNFFQ